MSSGCQTTSTFSPSVTKRSDGRTNPSRAQRRLCRRSNSRLLAVPGRSASDCRNHQFSASHSASGNNGRKMLVRTDFVRRSCNSVTGLSSTRIDNEAHVVRSSSPRDPAGSCHSKTNRRLLMGPGHSRVPIEIVDFIRPFFGLQLPALVLSKPAIHETRFVDNLSDLAPRIPRKAAFPGTAETLLLKRSSQPLLNLSPAATHCRVTFRRVSARSRYSGKRRPRLMFRTPDISDARGQSRRINAFRWWLNDSRLRSFSLRSTHGIPVGSCRRKQDPFVTMADGNLSPLLPRHKATMGFVGPRWVFTVPCLGCARGWAFSCRRVGRITCRLIRGRVSCRWSCVIRVFPLSNAKR